MWLRGVLPSPFSNVPDEYFAPNEAKHVYVPCITPIAECTVTSGLYYGGASGGAFSSYPKLTRCGVGLCKVDPSTEDRLWGVQINLPGRIQTAPRAELYASHLWSMKQNHVRNWNSLLTIKRTAKL